MVILEYSSLFLSFVAIIISIYIYILENKPKFTINLYIGKKSENRSQMACVRLNNYGNKPVEILDISFDKKFLNQSKSDLSSELLKDGLFNGVVINPLEDEYLIYLGFLTSKCNSEFENKKIKITCTYKGCGGILNFKRKLVREIDFSSIGICLAP